MGAWGEGPFSNDRAADLIATLAEPIQKVVDARTNASARQYYEEARAGVQFLLVSHNTDILGGPSLETALMALVRMREDVEWLSGWRSPEKIARTLHNELLGVLSSIYMCGKCRRSYGKRKLKKLIALVDKAHAVPVPAKARARSKPKRTSKVRTRLKPKRKGNRR